MTNLFSDNCHQTSITGFRNQRCVVQLSLGLPQHARTDPGTFQLAILAIRWKNALSPFVEYPYRVGPLSRRAKRTEVSLSLSHSFRKFLGLQVLPSSKPVQLPEGSKGQNNRGPIAFDFNGRTQLQPASSCGHQFPLSCRT